LKGFEFCFAFNPEKDEPAGTPNCKLACLKREIDRPKNQKEQKTELKRRFSSYEAYRTP